MATKKKYYGKEFEKKMTELKGGHKGVELTKGNRLPHGYEIVKGADKTKDYSKGKKKIVGLKKGHRLAHGYETEKGAKNKKYGKGGGFGKENTEMVANQNKAIKHHTEELKKILDSGINAPAWVVAKVGRAANDLSDVTHYLDGEKMETGGGVGYEILDDLKYDSFDKGGNMDSDEKMFCASIANRYLKVGDFVTENNLHIVREEDLKKAIEENMDSYSEEGKAIAKSVLSKI